MAKVDLLLPFILKWEGGFVNDPLDAGGATNMGVTLYTYAVYCKRKGYQTATVEDLKNINKYQVIDILKVMYWNRWQADKINNQSLANILVDWVWCSGIHGIKIPQKLLLLKQDGRVGPITLAAINNPDPEKLFNVIKAERLAFVHRIVNRSPSQKRFIKGWENRINDFKFEP